LSQCDTRHELLVKYYIESTLSLCVSYKLHRIRSLYCHRGCCLWDFCVGWKAAQEKERTEMLPRLALEMGNEKDMQQQHQATCASANSTEASPERCDSNDPGFHLHWIGIPCPGPVCAPRCRFWRLALAIGNQKHMQQQHQATPASANSTEASPQRRDSNDPSFMPVGEKLIAQGLFPYRSGD
jgi:hypothetical protein